MSNNKVNKFIMPNGEEIKIDSGGGLEICDIGTSLYVDETKGLRRRLNGSIMDITSNYQAFLTRLLEIKTTNPDYFTDEATWQSEATLNVDGCVYKFVLNYDSTGTNVVSVRLPKYPDYVEINAGGTLPVKGNGMALGLTDGVDFGLNENSFGSSGDLALSGSVSALGKEVGTSSDNFIKYNFKRVVGLTTDPTKSGIQTTLKQTKLKLRYLIQIATGSETENNIVNDIELNNPFSFGDYKYYPFELNNISWLKSNSQWNSKAVYPDYYDWILENVNNGKDGFKLSTNEYDNYDFVINTSDETFRLPLDTIDHPINSIGTLPVVGNGMSLGLYNGSQYAGLSAISEVSGQARVLIGDITNYGKPLGSNTGAGFGNTSSIGITTDPTKSGIVADLTATKANLYLYFYVGETVQNANLIDAGRIGEQLAGKQDKCIHIIDTYVNGTSGYRIWSDGYCEQWGTSQSGTTVVFAKTFKDKNYKIILGPRDSSNIGYGLHANSRSVSSFTIFLYGSDTDKADWIASGYLAEGEY